MANRWRDHLRWRIGSRLALLFAVVAMAPVLAGHWLAPAIKGEPVPAWLLVLASGALGWLIGQLLERQTTATLRRYRRAVRRLGRGDFTGSLDEADDDEWGLLAGEVDQAARSLEALRAHYEERLVGKESELGRMRADATRLGQENRRLQLEGLQRDKYLSNLQDFVIAINRVADPAQIAGQLLTYLDNEVEYSIATVMLVDPETQRLAPVAISNREKGARLVGKYIKDIQSLQPLGAKSAIGRVMGAGKPLLINNVEGDRRGLATRPEIKSELAVPLKVQDKVIGVLHLESTQPEAYSRQQESLLSLLANATATAVGNIRLFEEEAKVRMLREMDRVKSQLISTVSHELRTPLASIKGYSTSLQRAQGKPDERTRQEFLQIIEEEADRLSDLIENLLDMSKIEAGVLRVHKQPVQIERIVRKVLEQARRRAPQCRFRLRFAADLPVVAAAPHRIEQVVHNLVENAIKYSPEGGRIAISGEVEGDRVVVGVSDEGMGIPAEHVERIFEPFYQVDSGIARRVGGSGLGLAICRGFVEAHGGELWVESKPGYGSTFRFSLPLCQDADVAAVEVGATQLVSGG